MILGILQARTSSSRLPRKVMLPVAGGPMLSRQIERLLRARRLDRLIVATSDRPEDDCVANLASAAGIGSYRGSLDDVLDRYYRAAAAHAPSHVVRMTGDCPLADWDLIDRMIAFAVEGGFDYASNTLDPTWPDGLDVEVATFAAIETAWREASRPLEREHVMPFITSRPDRFRLGSMKNDRDLSAMRWTVDEPRDYAFVCSIYDALYSRQTDFTTQDVLALLAAHPEFEAVNSGIVRNEGLLRSALTEKKNESK